MSKPIAPVPRFSSGAYPRLLRILGKHHGLPATYEQWETQSEQLCDALERLGMRPTVVDIDPQKFAAWCRLYGKEIHPRNLVAFAQDLASHCSPPEAFADTWQVWKHYRPGDGA